MAKPANIPTTLSTQREAVVMTRYWWNRYRDLPWWRPFARREALGAAQAWGAFAKFISAVSSDV